MAARKRPQAPPPRWWRWVALALAAALLISSLGVGCLRWVDPPTTAFMEQREDLAEARNERHFRLKHAWVDLEQISPALWLAVLASEDQKFLHHFGFDVQAIEDAVEDRLEGRSTRGASTLSQQLAKNLFLWPGQSWVRKALEVYCTLLIEALWPKRRILEVYLNVAEFGDGIYGAEAAARTYFGKSAAALTEHEAALLAAVLPNPKARRANTPSPKVKKKVEWIEAQAERLPKDTVPTLKGR